MNIPLMAIVSLVVIISFFGVLLGFINNLTKVLRRTGENLREALFATAAIRGHCEQISPGIDAMNSNLYVVAAGLQNVGDATEQRVAKTIRGAG